MATALLVLPAAARFAGEALPHALGQALGRADRSHAAGGIDSLFDILPRGWPAAAVMRQHERGDAPGSAWVRADPAYVRPDINGARLLAIGEALGLDDESADALLQPLRPVFGDVGMPIEASSPGRWYLRLAPGAKLPDFVDPAEALGADLFDQLPAGPEGRRWRALLSEAQVTLHQHPLNAERAAAGLAPVNSVWFWGAGRLPDAVASPYSTVLTNDPAIVAFAALAGSTSGDTPASWPGSSDALAVDLRDVRRLDQLVAAWLEPALADVRGGAIESLMVQWADGVRFVMRRSQSLRFWRRPLRSMPPAPAQ